MADERSPVSTRLLTGLAWVVLLAGLLLWGSDLTDMPESAPSIGDVSGIGQHADIQLPPAHKPLPPARPHRIDIPAIGVQAPVVKRGLDADKAIDPPPYDQKGLVGWYGGGVKPGAKGAALFVGHVDTETQPAVFYNLSTLRPGQQIRVTRADGSLAEFTVEDVQVFTRDRFDAQQAYGQREPDRAELRLITCGGTFDRAAKAYTSNVVVSAYLTGAGP
ncbi:class F sortase [Streptomyces sp. T-3]|nr:class F sortase [Streptomyces sp. T-3]